MKKIKRALTDEEVRDMLRYYAYCQSLRDFIDDKVKANGIYHNNIKSLTNQLATTIEKQIDVLLAKNIDLDASLLVDQFVNASVQADNLFDTALKMQLLEEEKKIECATRISDILKEYGIE
jgi:hypothetical protein